MNNSKPTATKVHSNHTETNLMYAAISLTIFTCLLAFIAWGQNNSWQFIGLSLYQVFPIFGLLAFSIMWSQYVMAGVKTYLGLTPEVIKSYFQRTSLLVLAAILLHPGILIAQRFRDGYGLPPGSYLDYRGPMLRWVILLGSFSLMMFLAYEFKRFFGDKQWWKYVVLLNDIAILAIFYHGLRLGTDIGHSWFQIIWYIYGVILVPLLIYKYVNKLKAKRTPIIS